MYVKVTHRYGQANVASSRPGIPQTQLVVEQLLSAFRTEHLGHPDGGGERPLSHLVPSGSPQSPCSSPILCPPAPLCCHQAGLGKLPAQLRGGRVVNSPIAIKHNQEEICAEPSALADK